MVSFYAEKESAQRLGKTALQKHEYEAAAHEETPPDQQSSFEQSPAPMLLTDIGGA